MFTGYAFKMDGNQYQEVRASKQNFFLNSIISFFIVQIKVGENLIYGVHSLPNYANKDRDG